MNNEIKWINGSTIAKINFKIQNDPISLDPEHISKAEELVYRVKNQYFYVGLKDIFILSAAYLNSVTVGHIFPNGNKRTALATCGLFLFQNGFLLPDSQAANLKLADLTLKSTNHEISNEILANGIKAVAITPTLIFSKTLVKSFHR